MEILKNLLLVLFILVIHSTSSYAMYDFKTGEEYWNANKIHYHLAVAGQFRERHASKIRALGFLNEYQDTLEGEHHWTVNVQQGIDLQFILERGGFTQFQLYFAFNEAMVEIFDTTGEILNKAQYLRSDLNTVKSYTAEVLAFLKGVQHISKYVFKGEKNDFKEQEFLKSLNNAVYEEAGIINRKTDKWNEQMKKVYNGKINIEQYLDHHTEIYSKLFTNYYIFLKAHLESHDRLTQMQLRRKLERGLEDFEYNLTTINLLDPAYCESLGKKQKAVTPPTTTQSKKKRTRKRKKKQAPPQAESTPLLSSEQQPPSVFPARQSMIEESGSLPEITSIKTGLPSVIEEKGALSVSLTDQPLLSIQEEKTSPPIAVTTTTSTTFSTKEETKEDSVLLNNFSLSSEAKEQPLQEPDQITSLPHYIAALAHEEEGAHDLANLNYYSAYGYSTSGSTLMTAQESSSSLDLKKEEENRSASGQQQENIARIQRLKEVLEDFDGGPTAGMKTRKFLRLCAALNEQGFFSEFSANKKEVFIKMDNLVTVMHTNHSKKKKSPGISANTANKLEEVINRIQQ